MKRFQNKSKYNCSIGNFEYEQPDQICIRNIHFSILQPTRAKRTDKTILDSNTAILPMSSCRSLVKRIAAPIPKNTWDEAMQKFDQYFLSSLRRFDLIESTLTKTRPTYNGQIDDVRIYQDL